MPEYTTKELQVRGTVWDGVVSSSVVFPLCKECGALVGDTREHDLFHAALDTVADTAVEADRWAGLNRPIGGSGVGTNEEDIVWFPPHRPFEDL